MYNLYCDGQDHLLCIDNKIIMYGTMVHLKVNKFSINLGYICGKN